MNLKRIHIAKAFFLLLLTVSILLTSAGIYSASANTVKEPVKKGAASNTKQEKVTAAPTFEAVVVSFLCPEFAKEIFFFSFDFSPVLEKITLTTKRSIISEKYFHTLFTHFISPNAP
jgi:hypothetical protein